MSKLMQSLSALLLASAFPPPGLASAQNDPDSVKQYVATINLEQFKAAFDERKLGLLADVREPDEFAEGHIPGAINIPRALTEFNIWSEVGYPTKRMSTSRSPSTARPAGAARWRPDPSRTSVSPT